MYFAFSTAACQEQSYKGGCAPNARAPFRSSRAGHARPARATNGNMKSFLRCLAVLALLSTSSVQADDKPDPNFFPIMAWNNIPGDPAVMKKLHDCGFTVAGFVAAKDLDVANAAGLKAIVSDNRCGGYDWTKVD